MHAAQAFMALKLNVVLADSELAKAASLSQKNLLLAAYRAWKQAAGRSKTLQSKQAHAMAFLHYHRLRSAFICWKAAVATCYKVRQDSAVCIVAKKCGMLLQQSIQGIGRTPCWCMARCIRGE